MSYLLPMKIALCADEPYSIHETISALLRGRGHDVVPFGAVRSGSEVAFAEAAEEAAQNVADGRCDEGVFLCWSGTGISIAANKVRGIRAALCTDAGTARAARKWNHANVICLSHRLLTPDLAEEILDAWYTSPAQDEGAAGVKVLEAVDARHRR